MTVLVINVVPVNPRNCAAIIGGECKNEENRCEQMLVQIGRQFLLRRERIAMFGELGEEKISHGHIGSWVKYLVCYQ